MSILKIKLLVMCLQFNYNRTENPFLYYLIEIRKICLFLMNPLNGYTACYLYTFVHDEEKKLPNTSVLLVNY